MRSWLLIFGLVFSTFSASPPPFNPQIRTVVAGGGGTGLLTSLVSYWKFDESSGNAADSKGSNTLSPQNSATYAAGILNNAASLANASSQYFKCADSSTLSMADQDFSVVVWVKATTFPAVSAPVFKGTAWGIYLSGSTLFFQTAGTDLQLSPGTLSTGTWYMIAVTHTGVTHAKTLSVRGGSFSGTRSTNNGTPPSDDAGDFNIGAYNSGGAFFWDGLIDEVAVWQNRVISSADETLIYNSGSPLPFSSW